MEYFFTCPYCWQEISFILDTFQPNQEYIEDCEVCLPAAGRLQPDKS